MRTLKVRHTITCTLRDLLLLASALSLSSPCYAERRYEYLYTTQVIDEGASERYAGKEKVLSKDIIIFGDNVTISSEVLSNGGDVVIFAETLKFEAPIDTRVYIDHTGPIFSPTSGPCKSALGWLSAFPTVLDSYRFFYTMTDDVWDANAKSYLPAPRGIFPEIPSGTTPCAYSGKISSGGEIDDNKIRWPSLKSGNITIVAHSIEFCPECGKNATGWNGLKLEFPERASDYSPEKTFLNARGLRGSRGVMPLWGCQGGNIVDPNCRSLPDEGQRIPGSAGGDAGTIDIYVVENPSWLETNRLELLDRLSSAGGQSGGTERISAPCFARTELPEPCVRPPRLPTRLIFPLPNASPEIWQMSENIRSKGLEAPVSLEAISSTDAVTTIASVLISLESNKLKSYEEFIRAGADHSAILQYISPLDHLTEFLKNGKVALNLAAISLGLVPPKLAGDAPPYTGLFSKLDVSREANAGVHSDAYLFVLEMAPFQKFRLNSSLANYMADLGGLLEFRVPNAVASFKELRGELALANVVTAITHTEESILDLQKNTFEYAKINFEVQFKRQLWELRVKIDEAQLKADAWEEFSAVATNFKALVDTSDALYNDFFTGNYFGMAAKIGLLAHNIAVIDGVARLHAHVEQLRQIYKEVVDDLNSVVEQMNKLKAEQYEKEAEELKTILGLRKEYNKIYLEALSYSDDLLRLALVKYLMNGSAIDYNFNLHALRTLNTRYPEPGAGVNLSRISDVNPMCRGSSPKPITTVLQDLDAFAICAVSEPDPEEKKWCELYVVSGPLEGMILYRFPPTARPRIMELYALFRGRDMGWHCVSE